MPEEKETPQKKSAPAGQCSSRPPADAPSQPRSSRALLAKTTPSTTAATARFNRFLLLPLELQDLVWEHAIRSRHLVRRIEVGIVEGTTRVHDPCSIAECPTRLSLQRGYWGRVCDGARAVAVRLARAGAGAGAGAGKTKGSKGKAKGSGQRNGRRAAEAEAPPPPPPQQFHDYIFTNPTRFDAEYCLSSRKLNSLFRGTGTLVVELNNDHLDRASDLGNERASREFVHKVASGFGGGSSVSKILFSFGDRRRMLWWTRNEGEGPGESAREIGLVRMLGGTEKAFQEEEEEEKEEEEEEGARARVRTRERLSRDAMSHLVVALMGYKFVFGYVPRTGNGTGAGNEQTENPGGGNSIGDDLNDEFPNIIGYRLPQVVPYSSLTVDGQGKTREAGTRMKNISLEEATSLYLLASDQDEDGQGKENEVVYKELATWSRTRGEGCVVQEVEYAFPGMFSEHALGYLLRRYNQVFTNLDEIGFVSRVEIG
ncbi:hypothetical protein MKZ38_008779 [Zalerion maritima]|uniref:Uncharacterized protein n=1 Tax=Zalerion maritima TaxID=339359 RepID=A0AAD5RU31_9PEZI|nr:hypothetical protein MKZ38_008779 [Zalerion maritima]